MDFDAVLSSCADNQVSLFYTIGSILPTSLRIKKNFFCLFFFSLFFYAKFFFNLNL